MRILISCLQSPRDYPVPAYRYWETYFKRGIEEAGYEWAEVPGVDWAEGLTYYTRGAAREWRERTWTRVIEHLKREHQVRPVDFFLTYLYPPMVEPAAVAQIRAMGIPCVNYFCDNVREFTRVPEEYRAFDLNWVPELAATRMYQRDGVPFIHAPMLTWIDPSQRTCDHPETYGVSFVGSRDVQREVLLAQALALGAEIEIRGPGWPLASAASAAPVAQPVAAGAAAGGRKPLRRTVVNQIHFVRRHGLTGWSRRMAEKLRPGVPDAVFVEHVRERANPRQYVEITQQSRITLGVTRYPSYNHPFDRPDTYARVREVEAPMMGACYLTEWTEELELMYALGEEVETYRTAEEMVEKIRMLEADPARRRRMRCQAQRRALAEHSVPRSMQRVVERLGLGA